MPEESTAVAAPPNPGGLQEVNVSALASSKGPEPAGLDFTESFDALEKAMGAEPSQEAAKPDPKQKPAPTAEKKSQLPAKDTTKADPSVKDAKESDGQTTENGKALPAPELRKAYQELKVKHAALEKEYNTYKSTPREDPEKRTLSEKLAVAEKHRQQLDEELRHTAYERSEEFKQRYHAPFVSAYELGRETAAQFKITDAEGNQRQGSPEDFDALMQIPDADSAARWAEELYGTTRAAALLNHRQEVIKLARSRNGALQEAQKSSTAREQMRQEADTAQRKALSERWSKVNHETAEKYPNWFKEVEGDDKGNDLLRKGYEFADKAFNGAEMSPEALVDLHAALRNRAAAFGRLNYQLKNANSRITELEAELKSYQESEPSRGDGKGDKQASGELDWEKNLENSWVT